MISEGLKSNKTLTTLDMSSDGKERRNRKSKEVRGNDNQDEINE